MTKNRILIAVVVLIIAALACGGETSGTVVGTATPKPEPTKAVLTTYQPGEIIDVGDHTIVLNEYSFKGNVVVASFTIENTSNEEMTVSTLMQFNARNEEGERLSEEIFDCSPTLGGTIYAGERMRGNVCYKDASDKTRLYYEASLFGKGAIIWELSK